MRLVIDPPRLMEKVMATGLTMYTICFRAGIARSTLRCYLHGKVKYPKPATLAQLCKVLKCDYKDITKEEED